MYECRCPHDGKMLAEIARPPIQAMTGGQLCACGRWIIPRIELEVDQIIRTVRCICGYQMTSDLRQVMLQWCEERLKQPTADKEHVFVCLEETPFCREYYGKPFLHRQHLMETLCRRAKVKPFGFHGIRHLTASILYKKGYPLAVIQAILRHANPNTTARYIRSLGLEETRAALEEGLNRPAQVIEFQKVKAV